MTLPFVSVVVPTYNRHKFLPNLIQMFLYQKYPQERMELVILDDTEVEFDMKPYEKHANIRYIYSNVKESIPRKRNRLNNELSKGEIIVCMDDDDFYPSTRVSHAVKKLTTSKALIAGSTELYIYDTNTKASYRMGPYGKFHATNGTMAYKREYLKDNHYNEDTEKVTGEELFFTKEFSNPMVQLVPWDTIICINHQKNTFDKAKIFQEDKKVSINFKKLIKDKKVRDFFMSL